MDNESVFRAVMERGFGAGDLSVADKYAGDSIEEHEYLSPHGPTGAGRAARTDHRGAWGDARHDGNGGGPGR